MADASIWATFLLGVVVEAGIQWVVLFCFLLVMLPSVIPKLPTELLVRDLLVEGFLVFGNFLVTPSLRWVSIPNSFVPLFVFYILSYLLSKRMGCLSGCLVSSTSIQKLYCGSC